MTNRYPLHHEDAEPLYVTIPQEEYDRLCRENKELKEQTRWRNFSDGFPNENDYYLVTNGDFVDFEFGCYNEQDEEWNWDHNGKWKWWMPLPEPPKEEK